MKLIIAGGARGADQLGYHWAWKHALPHQLFRTDWERFGRSAGIRRHHQMAQAGHLLVAFWDVQSQAPPTWRSACASGQTGRGYPGGDHGIKAKSLARVQALHPSSRAL